MKEKLATLGNTGIILLMVLFVSCISYRLGYNTSKAEEKEVMIKHLISPFHNAEHVFKNEHTTDYQVVPLEMNCDYVMDSTTSHIDTTDG